MIFEPIKLQGAFIICLEKLEDDRGFFARACCKKEFESHGLLADFVQCNLAFNKTSGTLRGMHYQTAPRAEAKLVRCIRAAIYDVAVDLRPDSPTYTQWYGVELSAENRKMLYIPEGFAHGYQTLSDNAELLYQVTQFYSPECERGVRWNDPAFGITWPDPKHVILSPKDRNWPDFVNRLGN